MGGDEEALETAEETCSNMLHQVVKNIWAVPGDVKKIFFKEKNNTKQTSHADGTGVTEVTELSENLSQNLK